MEEKAYVDNCPLPPHSPPKKLEAKLYETL